MSEKQILLNNLYNLYRDFKSSSLFIEGSQSIVFGEGSPNSPLIFIGEAPGREEDEQARPFVGRSGKLLTKAIENCGVSRKDVFITNIVKCRPPENRTPTPQEIETGKKLLLQNELSIIKPKVIVTLGLCSLKGFLETPMCMSRVRGTSIPFGESIIFPVYHPAYILRNQSVKDIFFSDILHALKLAGFKTT